MKIVYRGKVTGNNLRYKRFAQSYTQIYPPALTEVRSTIEAVIQEGHHPTSYTHEVVGQFELGSPVTVTVEIQEGQ